MWPTGVFTKQTRTFWVEMSSQPQLDHMFAGLERTLQDFSWVLPPLHRSRIYQFFVQGIHYYQQVTVSIFPWIFDFANSNSFQTGKKTKCDELDFICLTIFACCSLRNSRFNLAILIQTKYFKIQKKSSSTRDCQKIKCT